MNTAVKSSAFQSGPAPDAVTIHVPIAFRRRGGRRATLAANDLLMIGSSERLARTPIVTALAKAFRWRRVLEGGKYATLREIGAAEGLNESYLSRVIRLTLLAPDIIEALLDGRGDYLDLRRLLAPLPMCWSEQKAFLLEHQVASASSRKWTSESAFVAV